MCSVIVFFDNIYDLVRGKAILKPNESYLMKSNRI